MTEHFESSGLDHAAALSLDLLPAPDARLEAPDIWPMPNARKLFTHVCDLGGPPSQAYLDEARIAEDFGPAAALPWRVDTYYHAESRITSLRRIPLFRHQAHRYLDEGLRRFYGTFEPDTDLWKTWPILPIFSYGLSFARPEDLERIRGALPQIRPVREIIAEGFPN